MSGPPVTAFADLFSGGSVAVLTGAGLSTDSGIPDYRGPGSPPRRPMTYQQFLTPAGRQRYWARSFVGFERVAQARPNPGHLALARLERAGLLAGVVTQNVDRLHQSAGSSRVIDLHGRIDRVICLDCDWTAPRADFQRRLVELNPDADLGHEIEIAPDGDAALDDTTGFVVAGCPDCGGIVKPDVVYFGESVPAERVRAATELTDGARALLVAGSSLTVYSGRRFVLQAVRRAIPVLVINRGPTRADDVATHRWESGTSPALTALADSLGTGTGTGTGTDR